MLTNHCNIVFKFNEKKHPKTRYLTIFKAISIQCCILYAFKLKIRNEEIVLLNTKPNKIHDFAWTSLILIYPGGLYISHCFFLYIKCSNVSLRDAVHILEYVTHRKLGYLQICSSQLAPVASKLISAAICRRFSS